MASKPQKTKNGWYYIIWTDGKRTPRQITEALKTQSLSEARIKKADLESRYFLKDDDPDKHDPWVRKWYNRPDKKDAGVSYLTELYIQHKQKEKGRYGWKTRITAKSKSNTIKQFARHVAGKDITHVTKRDLSSFYERPGMSDGGKKSYHSIISGFLNWCVREEYLKKRPVVHVDQPVQKIPEYIYPADLEKIYQYHKDKVQQQIDKKIVKPDSNHMWMIDAWRFISRTGLRPNEFINLKVSDIRENEILIGSWYTTKTRLQRIVPIFDEIRPVVRKYTSEVYRSKDPLLRASDRLFGRKGDSAKRRLSAEFTEAVESACPHLGYKTLYNLRDTFAVWYLMQPSDQNMDFRLTRLMFLMGHKQITTTQIYLRAIAGILDSEK